MLSRYSSLCCCAFLTECQGTQVRVLKKMTLLGGLGHHQQMRSLHDSPTEIHYIQGQSPEPRVREYFYYIDHQGQLFLDDARIKNFTSCFKEKKFLQFFMNQLRNNNLSPPRYPEFPFLSPCGRERNFVRCEDRPIVYTQLIENPDGAFYLSYNNAGDLLRVDFNPECLSMDPSSGRVYYPFLKAELGRGLVKSSLAIELSKGFEFENGDESKPPKWFNWHGQKYTLKNCD